MTSPLLKAIHETAQDLATHQLIDKQTMREFDALCLPVVPDYNPAQIKSLRLRFNASQAVFAAYLNTSTSTIQKWEQGQKSPRGSSLKLLSLVDKRGLEVLG
jgi:putative transcriptional regulator